jgi:hypothetical protein
VAPPCLLRPAAALLPPAPAGQAPGQARSAQTCGTRQSRCSWMKVHSTRYERQLGRRLALKLVVHRPENMAGACVQILSYGAAPAQQCVQHRVLHADTCAALCMNCIGLCFGSSWLLVIRTNARPALQLLLCRRSLAAPHVPACVQV